MSRCKSGRHAVAGDPIWPARSLTASSSRSPQDGGVPAINCRPSPCSPTQLGVSRSSMREAIRRLQAQGLVQVLHGRGTVRSRGAPVPPPPGRHHRSDRPLARTRPRGARGPARARARDRRARRRPCGRADSPSCARSSRSPAGCSSTASRATRRRRSSSASASTCVSPRRRGARCSPDSTRCSSSRCGAPRSTGSARRPESPRGGRFPRARSSVRSSSATRPAAVALMREHVEHTAALVVRPEPDAAA